MGVEVDFLPVDAGEKSGDAIALRYGNLYGPRNEQVVVVIDGGFQKNGEELVKHIKKYYKTDRVDLVISSHPDSDHVSGLRVVLEQLDVGALWMHRPWKHTSGIADMFEDGRVTDSSVRKKLEESLNQAINLEELARQKGIPITEPFQGLSDDDGNLKVLGPSEEFYESLLPLFQATPEPKEEGFIAKAIAGAKDFIKKVAERWDFETLDDEGETAAENNSSVILLLSYDGRNLLFTSDAGMPALEHAADYLDMAEFDCSDLTFIQVPHHGSQRNVGPTILNRILGPKRSKDVRERTAFVSASKEGEPKHPSKKVINAFRRRGCPVHATQGHKKWHNHDAPDRSDFSTSTPLPFYDEVEE